jgi:hypothetical protein
MMQRVQYVDLHQGKWVETNSFTHFATGMYHFHVSFVGNVANALRQLLKLIARANDPATILESLPTLRHNQEGHITGCWKSKPTKPFPK